jgi:chemotaxis protein MotB
MVAGVILLAGILTSATFILQRNDARNQLRGSEGQIEELKGRISELNASLENQESRSRTERDLIEQKRAALEAAEFQTTELKSLLKERQVEIDSVRIHLQEAGEEIKSLKQELASSEVKLADLTEAHGHLKGERSTQKARIEDMARELVESGAKIAMLEAKVKDRDEGAAALERALESLQARAAVKEQQLTESQDKAGVLRSENDGLKKELVAVKASISVLEIRLKQVADDRDGLMTHTRALKAEGDDLLKRMAEMDARYGEMLTDRNEKITALSSAMAARGEKLAELERDKNNLSANLEASSRTITGLRDQLKELITHVPALKGRLEQSLENYQTVQEDLTEAQAAQAKLEAQQRAMRETYEALMSGLKQQLDSREASIEEYREKLKVTFVDRILFGFSQVSISAGGKTALDQLAKALTSVPEGKISVIGHADNIPVATKYRSRFPSNWELSSARAGAVARYLLNRADLDPSRIEVVGLSRYHPLADNDTEAGRARNRRVEIIITPGRHSTLKS